jgi:hypothetical protein
VFQTDKGWPRRPCALAVSSGRGAAQRRHRRRSARIARSLRYTIQASVSFKSQYALPLGSGASVDVLWRAAISRNAFDEW